MKNLKYFFLLLIAFSSFQSCEKEDTEPQRTTHLVTLENRTGISGCSTAGLTVTFNVSYRDISVDVEVDAEREAYINVLVEDNESINVKVKRTSDNTPLADTNVNVRTESRPENLAPETRRIAYCLAFNLSFHDF